MNIQFVCPECEAFNDINDAKCWKCERSITESEKQFTTKKAEQEIAEKTKYASLDQEEKDSLLINNAKNTGDWVGVSEELINKESQKITLTASYTLASQKIETEIAIITSEVAYGMNIFRDLFAGVRDVVGGRSDAVQKVLRDARKTALFELKKEALFLDADAVIAIDLDYQELSSMVLLVASGTAVKVKK